MSFWSCSGLFIAFMNAPYKHTQLYEAAFFWRARGVERGSWMPAFVYLWILGKWLLDGCRQSVCVHTAVFQPGADQPSPLISVFNAIMPVGAASVSLWHLLCSSHCSFNSLKEEIHLTLMYLLLLCIFFFYFLLYPPLLVLPIFLVCNLHFAERVWTFA